MAFDYGAKKPNGQYTNYPSLPADGDFVRPVRESYRHLKCGTITIMGKALAETYARNPTYYGATFCVGCGDHYPVGASGEFDWAYEPGVKVGT